MQRASIHPMNVSSALVFDSLSENRRRRILRVLRDRTAPVTERELATVLASTGETTPARTVSREAVESTHANLVHAQLPRLADVGLIDWNQAEETVTTAETPLFEESWFEEALTTTGEYWDEVFGCLSHERRLIALAVLEAQDGPVKRDDLASKIASREQEGKMASREQEDTSARAVENVIVSLHHVHLPKLHDAGLVEYDPQEETVHSRGVIPILGE